MVPRLWSIPLFFRRFRSRTMKDNAVVPQAPTEATQPGNADVRVAVAVETTGKTDNINQIDSRSSECRILPSELSRVFSGVVVATKTPEDVAAPVHQWISSCGNKNASATALLPHEWCKEATLGLAHEDSQQLARVAIGVAFLQGISRNEQSATPADLAMVWGLVRGAITHTMTTGPRFNAVRSSQGFLSVALCSLLKDGNIDELYRFHIWLPDGQRGDLQFAVHSHQAFAQSWILAGEGSDYRYSFEPVESMEDATHAQYALSWTDNKNTSTTYKTHQTSSTVVNTGKLGRTTQIEGPTAHTRDMSYCIPSAKYHKTEVAPDGFHATLFVFDSHRGFVKDAPVLGPKDSESSTQFRDPAGVTPAALANMVETMRSWEVLMEQGKFEEALKLCESAPDFPNTARYKQQVLGQLGNG